jgi:hypothetical protein
MAHNPIIKKMQIGLTDNVNIPLNTVGLLYSKNRFSALLHPGDGISFTTKLSGGLDLYLVDCAPHDAIWRANWTSKNEQDIFPVTIRLRYRVMDSGYMVSNAVNDTELLVSRALEPSLRKKAREFTLHQHRELEAELENLIQNASFSNLGLSLDSVDVTLNFSNADLERIKQYEALARAMKHPQQTVHDDELPSSEPAYKFITHTTVTYRVVEPSKLPTTTLAEAEDWLWTRVLKTLRREGRKFSIENLAEAEYAMQKAVEDEVFSNFGLEVETMEVFIDLDEKAQAQAVKLAELRAQKSVEETQGELESMRKKRELDSKKSALDFYLPMIKDGKVNVVALMLAENKADSTQILEYLDGDEAKRLAREDAHYKDKFELLKTLMNRDDWSEKTGKNLADSIITGITNPNAQDIPAQQQLAAGNLASQLPSGTPDQKNTQTETHQRADD